MVGSILPKVFFRQEKYVPVVNEIDRGWASSRPFLFFQRKVDIPFYFLNDYIKEIRLRSNLSCIDDNTSTLTLAMRKRKSSCG